MITLADADTYFLNHLDGARWQAFDEATRTAAIQTAARDVAAKLRRETIDAGRLFQCYAVCEQALFLASDESGQRELLVSSEQIEGLGSRSYVHPARAEAGWSPRALRMRAEPVSAYRPRLTPIRSQRARGG